SRKGVERDARSRAIEEEEIARIMKDQNDEIQIIRREALQRLKELTGGKLSAGTIKEERSGKVLITRGEKITAEKLARLPVKKWKDLSVAKGKDLKEELEGIIRDYQERVHFIKENFEGKIAKLKKGDELPPGVIKMVKVYLAVKRKLSVGDKMAGRHGNKGVVSRILPKEDLPYFADGTPVDIVLNPLGVPSRMNVGQVMETHLGWASRELGRKVAELVSELQRHQEARKLLKKVYESKKIDGYFDQVPDEGLGLLSGQFREGIHMATPVFDGANEADIQRLLRLAGLSETGQARLFDGRSGDPFDRPVTVGVMYMMKLHHLVDDKIHARSIGPYSLVTQQPLGGKAQFGGQRLGEMEVWAMEAYGAAYTLQEFLTVKSDDVVGRTRMYEKIVKGDNVLEAGLPESFNVLVKELQSLGLNIELLEGETPETAPGA
ncbi:MAG: DNA-directed RNA polymerase subunit beta, partial [Desulfobacterota bacterium]|nr:DNA-directed RNA polymerase subunit beta [Thermodesulfobacteriota bacterium]